jgi:ribosome biogenesis GTPase / thiamine phosphate phosphatase
MMKSTPQKLLTLGLSPERFLSANLSAPTTGQQLARILEQHRAGFVIDDGDGPRKAKAHPRLKHTGGETEARPGVGDWVWFSELPGEKMALLESILPRFSALRRGAAGERYATQIIAANIDIVIVLMGLDRDFNPRRVERYLLLVRACGAKPIVALSKVDKIPASDAADAMAVIQDLDPNLLVLTINGKDPASVTVISQQVKRGQTAVLVGSSGAGKSTLTNTLAGRDINATGSVRESDGRGRHTTVHRSLIRLPDGGLIIDTPGLRELKLTGMEAEVVEVFHDIEELSARCKFRDCKHAAEPGCAVVAAIESGELGEGRWQSFQKLTGERVAQRREITNAQRKSLTRMSKTKLASRWEPK